MKEICEHNDACLAESMIILILMTAGEIISHSLNDQSKKVFPDKPGYMNYQETLTIGLRYRC